MKTAVWRRWWSSARAGKRGRPVLRGGPQRRPLRVEQLEDRTLLSGTPQLLADINPGAPGSYPSQMVTIGSITYFAASDSTHGNELWKTDGTAAGTVLVADINLGSGGSNPSNLTNFNGTLFFTANDGTHGTELWKTDGTAANTVMVADVNPGAAGSNPGGLTAVNGTLYFTANDGVHGYQLWKSDGTAANTVMVADINPGGAGSYPSNLTNVNGELFFTANDGTHGTELWKSDGTAANTVLVKDIYPGTYTGYFGGTYPNSSYPKNLTNVNGTLYFTANDGNGIELWKSDGTATGTTMVKDINPGTSTSWYYTGVYGAFTRTVTTTGSYPSNLTNVNGTLYFVANDGTHGTELWKSDGTAAGTTLVRDIYPGSTSHTYTNYYYNGAETRSATLPNSSYPGSLANLNGTLLFGANDGTHGNELWAVPAGPSLAVSAASTTPTAGQADTFTITALNADGTPDTTLNGTVTLTSSDPKAVLPASVTLTGGTAQFSATFKTAGPQSITATDVQTPTDQGMESDLVVQAAAASSFTLTGLPSPATLGTAGTFTVTAYDTYGNVATGYGGTVHFTSSDPKAALPADATLTGGTGQFSATLNTLGTSQSLTATDKNNAALTATQTGIEVVPFAIVTGPPAGAIGQTLTYTLGAGGDPAGTVFSVSWGDGTSVQTTATTVSHTYSSSANYSVSVTATAAGLTSNPATQAVDIVPVSVTVAADPARAGADMVVVATTANYAGLILGGSSSGVTLTYNGTALGTIAPNSGSSFALVEVFGQGSNNALDAPNLSVSTVLVGGPGSDTLEGGSGRNLLIGGPGPDTLFAGTAGDILIGGTTSYDSNTAANQKALAYLAAEWGSTASYATRIKQLSGKAGSGGLNGSYFLNSSTVFDDSATDALYGNSQAAGASLDWFFAHHARTNGDQVYNLVSGETVTRV